MTTAHSDKWPWSLDAYVKRELARAMAQPIDWEVIRGNGVFAGHAYGCRYPGGGGMCDCGVIPAPSRGFDYGTLTARLAEGYWEDDDEGGNDGDLG